MKAPVCGENARPGRQLPEKKEGHVFKDGCATVALKEGQEQHVRLGSPGKGRMGLEVKVGKKAGTRSYGPSCKTEVLGRVGDHGPAWGSGEPWKVQGRGANSLFPEG